MQDKTKSKRRQRITKSFPIFPLLFGIYPILALTAFNITQIDLSLTFRSIILSVAFSAGLYGILQLAMRDWRRAALLSFLLLVLFFSYGHIYSLIKNTSILGIAIGRHRLLMPIWAALGGLAVWLSTRKSISLISFTNVFNIITAILLLLPIGQIAYTEFKSQAQKPAITANAASIATATGQPEKLLPDIYYIILDAYGRTDKLHEVYGLDNSAFIQALTKKGFYIAQCSQSNYGYTELSLASSLNLDYLDKLSGTDDDQLIALIQGSLARQFLEAHGYTTVAFETGWRWSQWENANYYFGFQPSVSVLNGFEFMYLQTTALRLPLDYMNMTEHPTTYYSIHHDRILYNLSILKNLPGLAKSPKFVFAHLVVPHPPFVFGPSGDLVINQGADTASNIQGYTNSVTFIDQAILQVVDRLIATSKTPPVIVIQGDHGPFFYSEPIQHMAILNAYYLPGATNTLYPSISPVNTFRVILNSYFGQTFPLLKDVSWYSKPNERFDFQEIPNGCTP